MDSTDLHLSQISTNVASEVSSLPFSPPFSLPLLLPSDSTVHQRELLALPSIELPGTSLMLGALPAENQLFATPDLGTQFIESTPVVPRYEGATPVHGDEVTGLANLQPWNPDTRGADKLMGSTRTPTASELVFIDAAVDDAATLMQGIASGVSS